MALMKKSSMPLCIHQFTRLARMMPINPMNNKLPMRDKSIWVVYPAMAMMAKVPAVMTKTWVKLPNEYM